MTIVPAMTGGGEPGAPRPGGSSEALTCTEHGPVWVLRWDRQERRNALDPASLEALADRIAAATADPAVRVCVLTGTGDVAFSSGMDLRALADDPSAAGRAVERWRAALDDPSRVVLLAAVNGMAMGGGFEIALVCDLVVAAAHATFGLPEVTKGIVPRGGALGLPAMVPVQTAIELAVTGDHVPASRLHQLGLVNRVVPADELLDTALALGGQIAGYPAETVSEIRRSMWATARAAGAAPSP